jgi:hypothetical protein
MMTGLFERFGVTGKVLRRQQDRADRIRPLVEGTLRTG